MKNVRAGRIATILTVGVLLLAVLWNPATAAAPEQAALLAQTEAGITARSALAVDLDSGLELYAHAPDEPVPPASTAKLLTALVAEQVLDRSETIVIEEQDIYPDDYSRMGLEPGDIATVEQLLYGTLIPSGADAAHALARTAGRQLDPEAEDPVARFVDEMNAKAAELGMTGSHFENPVGQDDPGSVTTSRDMVRAAEAILDNWLLAKIVATPWTAVPVQGQNPRELVIENTNQFVLHDGAIGVKTGTTDAAGENLVNAFRYGDHRIITVVLGSADRYADTMTILSAIDQRIRWLPLGGSNPSIGAAEELAAQGLWMPAGPTLVLSAEQAVELGYQIEIFDNPEGRQRGTVYFSIGNAVFAELPVYAQGEPGGG